MVSVFLLPLSCKRKLSHTDDQIIGFANGWYWLFCGLCLVIGITHIFADKIIGLVSGWYWLFCGICLVIESSHIFGDKIIGLVSGWYWIFAASSVMHLRQLEVTICPIYWRFINRCQPLMQKSTRTCCWTLNVKSEALLNMGVMSCGCLRRISLSLTCSHPGW